MRVCFFGSETRSLSPLRDSKSGKPLRWCLASLYLLGYFVTVYLKSNSGCIYIVSKVQPALVMFDFYLLLAFYVLFLYRSYTLCIKYRSPIATTQNMHSYDTKHEIEKVRFARQL